MLSVITATGLFLSIHTASPGTTGANEIVGGTGYSGTRKAVTWGSVTSGVVNSNDTQSFTMLVSEAGGIPFVGLWTASSGGTYLCGGATIGLTNSIAAGAVVTIPSGLQLVVGG